MKLISLYVKLHFLYWQCDLVKDGLAEDIPQYDELCKKEGFEGWFKTSAKDNINIDESTRFLVTKVCTCENSAYHHRSCDWESRSSQDV